MIKLVRPCISARRASWIFRLGARIDGRRRLVQNQQPRIGQHRAGNCQQLALPLRQVAAVILNDGIIALRQMDDK